MTPQPRVTRFGDPVEEPAQPAAPAQKTTRFGDPVETPPAQTTSQADTTTETKPKPKYLPLPEVLKVVENPLFRQKSSIEKIGWLNSVDPEFKKLPPKDQAEFIQSKMQKPEFWSGEGGFLQGGVLPAATRTGQFLIRGIHGAGKLVGQDWFPESSAMLASRDPEDVKAIKAVTTPAPTAGGQAGAATETLAEWAVPIPGLGALKAARTAPFLARAGLATARGGLEAGLKTWAETGDPKEALETGAVAGPIGGVLEAAVPMLARNLNTWAKSQYGHVLHPLGMKAKEVAEEQIPNVIKEGYRAAAAWTKGGLMEKFNAKVADLGPKITREYQALDQNTRTLLDPIYHDIEAWMNREVFTQYGNVKDPELGMKALEVWDFLQTTFGQYAKTAHPSEVWEIRQALDKYVYRNQLTASDSVAAATQVKKAFGNIIRNQLNTQHPSVAALNNQYHMWAAAAELMQRNIRGDLGKLNFARNTGVIGRFLMGAAIGGGEAKRRGAGIEIWGPAAALGGLAVQSTAWRTVGAVTKAKVAELLVNGNGPAAANLAARAVGLTERATGMFATPKPGRAAAPSTTSSPAGPQSIPNLLADASKRYGVPLELLHKIAQKETGGLKDRATAVSPKGAIGVMQIMPATGADYGLSKEDLQDPAKNIDMSARYLRWILDRPYIAWDQTAALRAYNAGVGHVQRGEPDVKETRDYVQ